MYCNYGNWNSQDDIDPKNSKLFEATQQQSVRFQMQGIVDQMTATIPDDQKSSAKSLKRSTRLRVASEPKVVKRQNKIKKRCIQKLEHTINM